MSEFQDAVLALADTPWILVVLAVLSFVDGFFSPLPSESIIIAVAALAAAGSGPPLWLVVPVLPLIGLAAYLLGWMPYGI